MEHSLVSPTNSHWGRSETSFTAKCLLRIKVDNLCKKVVFNVWTNCFSPQGHPAWEGGEDETWVCLNRQDADIC